MLKVGITGGIGSGKSTVCQVFQTLGIPVFNADDAARHLMENDTALKAAIERLLGSEAFVDGKISKAGIRDVVFKYPDKLQQLNALVHPATVSYGRAWMDQQQAPYVIKEAAIFFETGSNRDMDVMIGVYAPLAIRMERAIKRSNLSQEKVMEIVNAQMDEDAKMKLCDRVITNDGSQAIIPQVLEIHKYLLLKAG